MASSSSSTPLRTRRSPQPDGTCLCNGIVQDPTCPEHPKTPVDVLNAETETSSVDSPKTPIGIPAKRECPSTPEKPASSTSSSSSSNPPENDDIMMCNHCFDHIDWGKRSHLPDMGDFYYRSAYLLPIQSSKGVWHLINMSRPYLHTKTPLKDASGASITMDELESHHSLYETCGRNSCFRASRSKFESTYRSRLSYQNFCLSRRSSDKIIMVNNVSFYCT